MTKEELQSFKIEPQTKSTVRISGEIPFAYLAEHRKAALAYLGKDIAADGFRKGHIPENILVGRIGEMAVLTEMAEKAISKIYPEIIKEHDLDVVGYPKISITKIAPGNPLGITAEVAILPEVTLPDYKEIAKGVNKNSESKEVTDAEVDKQIEDLLRQKLAYERLQEKAQAKKDMGGATELPTPESVQKDETDIDPKELPLPELTDEYVKTLGQPGQFNSVADFKTKIREHLKVEKERDVISRHRAKITDGIVAVTNIELPQVMIDAEINQMFAQMTEDLTRAQLTFEDYLSHIKKTKEDLAKEWAPAAEKRAKLQLVLNEIAEKEHVEADKGKVDHEVSHLLEHYKDADETRVRIYVESILRNEAVLKMLEDLK
jgi:trigger factor